jgi:hypothetical protein
MPKPADPFIIRLRITAADVERWEENLLHSNPEVSGYANYCKQKHDAGAAYWVRGDLGGWTLDKATEYKDVAAARHSAMRELLKLDYPDLELVSLAQHQAEFPASN